jgi:hypothetical protein
MYKRCPNIEHCLFTERDGATGEWTALRTVELRGSNYLSVIFW